MSTPAVALDSVDQDVAVAAASSPAFARRLLRNPVAISCLAFIALVVAVAIIAPIVLPDVASQNAGDLLAIKEGPSRDHPLGTDMLGRDVLERLLVGTRVTIVGVLEALIVGLALGVPLGLAAGYLGGRVDRVVAWLADLTFSIPHIILILVVLAVFPQSMLAAMITLGVLAAPGLMRIVRSAVLPVREELYIAAARVAGLSHSYIIGRHVLPRVAGPIIVQASLLAAVALLAQTGLAFLNLVVEPPAPSWGGMVADGLNALFDDAWLIWPPGVTIGLLILAFGLLGDAVRDTTNETWQVSGARSRRRLRPAALPPVDEPLLETDSDALLAVEGVSVDLPSREGSVRIIENVSFTIRKAEIVGLVGESGCGKTMTALAVLGLLPASGYVSSGHIRFAERDLVTLSDRDLHRLRGREIAYISQEPMVGLNPAFRVGTQLVESIRRHHDISRRAARARALELLEQVHLPDPASVVRRYAHELSGGMAQRVAIARALAGEPRLLIADEPTTALDVTVQAEILDLFRELQRERDMAILLVTHDWGVIADICDRAVVMYAGEVVERADLHAIIGAPRHPYTEALLASDPHRVHPDSQVLPTIPGTVPRPGSWPDGCHFHPRCRYVADACVRRAIPLERVGHDRETRCIRHELLVAGKTRMKHE